MARRYRFTGVQVYVPKDGSERYYYTIGADGKLSRVKVGRKAEAIIAVLKTAQPFRHKTTMHRERS